MAKNKHSRIQVLKVIYLLGLSIITLKLFYWQVIAKSSLVVMADQQHQSSVEISADRGEILSSDGFPLVHNIPSFTMFAYTRDMQATAKEVSEKLAPILAELDQNESTDSSVHPLEWQQLAEESIFNKLYQSDKTWIPLRRDLFETTKKKIDSLNIHGIGFDQYQVRTYPESSMAAQLVGFVGSDGAGQPKGYFGLEGEYDFELRGKPGIVFQEKDALGRPIPIGTYSKVSPVPGHTIQTHIHRGLQHLVEQELLDGIERYGAVSGEIVIMNPKTGAILSLAAFPSYDPQEYKLFPQEAFKIPSIADVYEPGSTFKTIVMAAAIDTNSITSNTQCDSTCNGPVNLGGYTIRTWNDEYRPNQTMTEVLEHSDNTGMIFVMNQLKKDKFLEYLEKFGLGKSTGIDLQSETVPELRNEWRDIDLATGSFGQGLAVTSIQMVSAVSAIANQGKRMKPHVVKSIITQDKVEEIKPEVLEQVISPKSADIMIKMMVRSAQHGEAQWAVPDGYQIAGKTGTAQIPIAGHYDKDKTIASFIGFAPASDPRFVMLVKLTEPSSSPWASETAAPLWFGLTKKIFPLLNISIK